MKALSSYLPVPSCMNIMVLRLSPQPQRVMQRHLRPFSEILPADLFALYMYSRVRLWHKPNRAPL